MNDCFALKGGTLIDGTGRGPINNSIVVVRGSVIEKVGEKGEIDIPREAKVIDISGKTIMPGLIDAHTHLTLPETPNITAGWISMSFPMLVVRAVNAAKRTLEAGFTTIRDAGSVGQTDVALRDSIKMGLIPGPRIVACGKGICQTGGHGRLIAPWVSLPMGTIAEEADGPDEVRKAVRKQLQMNVDFIKSFASGGLYDPSGKMGAREFSDEEMKALIDEAHMAHRPVAMHTMIPDGVYAAIKAGLSGKWNDTVEHGVMLSHDVEALKEIKRRDLPLIMTFTVYACMAGGMDKGIPKHAVENAIQTRKFHEETFRKALELGIKIGCGTDMGGPLAIHGNNAIELKEMVSRGMSPMQAIVAATKNSAEAIGLGDKIGTIEQGKLADIIVVDGDPLQNIGILLEKERIKLVMKEGQILVRRD